MELTFAFALIAILGIAGVVMGLQMVSLAARVDKLEKDLKRFG